MYIHSHFYSMRKPTLTFINHPSLLAVAINPAPPAASPAAPTPQRDAQAKDLSQGFPIRSPGTPLFMLRQPRVPGVVIGGRHSGFHVRRRWRDSGRERWSNH